MVKIIIIPTNEEYMIARDTYELIHDDLSLLKLWAMRGALRVLFDKKASLFWLAFLSCR